MFDPSFVVSSKFHNKSGALITKSLFLEEYNEKAYVQYTLKTEDFGGYPSLYRLYMEESDPTEWKFVQKYLYSWEHWEMICETPWFKPHIARWRKELELKLRSEALTKIRQVAESKENKSSFEANKFLLNGNWGNTQEGKKRGRPSKDEIRQEATRLVSEDQKINEDYKRLQ